MLNPDFYAHTLEDCTDCSRWQKLHEHLQGVANRTAQFADAFSSADWGYLAGLWHDLGKYQPEFQEKLRGIQRFAEHSGAGAVLAARELKDSGIPLAFAIAGHHAGLANLAESGHGFPTRLKERLQENQGLLQRIFPDIPACIANQPVPQLPAFLRMQSDRDQKRLGSLRRSTELWTRFLFSLLVDADRLDTEEFTNPASSSLRSQFSSLGQLRQRLDSYIDCKVTCIPADTKNSPVNIARSQVLQSCLRAAEEASGVFSLAVPTGGGKTLSGMSFALHHAEHNGLRRVIVVIPYTSIIDQNAREYCMALGVENVVEHHSNLDPLKQKAQHGEEVTRRHDLACENWDAPVVVTTSVQFFETLFSNRPSQCRKLHNIARSVIILDEVQTLPPGYLLSILDVLNELVANYGCSLVLSTATPPALAAREGFECGLENIRPIIPDLEHLAENLKRVEYVWPDTEAQPLDWTDLASMLAGYSQVLAVVHKRNDARILAQQLQEMVPGEPILHLSALMCAAHRLDVLARIKDMLACGEPCRVISTQLVEAGVDLDFPVVFRALGGLDSVVQAAGRCNREGRLKRGEVVVFRARTSPPRGTPKRGMEVTENLLKENRGMLDPNDHVLLETYFRSLYFAENKDARNIQGHREQFNFATVGHEFKMIEDGFTQSVIVPYGEGRKRLDNLRREGPNRENRRGLQPFIVNIYPDAFEKLLKSGALYQDENDIFSLTQGFEHLYDNAFGLVVGDEPAADPRAFMF